MAKLVVYYSLEGNTKFVAEKTAELAGADILEIKPQKPYPTKGFMKYFHGGKDVMTNKCPKLLPYEFDGDKYDEIIIATPTWAGSYAPPINTFINENKEVLKTKEISVYVGYRGNGDSAVEAVRKAIGVEKLKSTLTLLDPYLKPNEENLKKIEAFAFNKLPNEQD